MASKPPPLPDHQPDPSVSDSKGCQKCKAKKCTFCTTHLQVTNTFISVRSKHTFKIRHAFTCQSRNLVYLLDCRKCANMQYVGETGQKLKDRITQHRSDIRTNKETLVAKHFNSNNHTVDDLACTAIEQIRSTNIEVRKQQEKKWRDKLRTHYPDGLNVWDSV